MQGVSQSLDMPSAGPGVASLSSPALPAAAALPAFDLGHLQTGPLPADAQALLPAAAPDPGHNPFGSSIPAPAVAASPFGHVSLQQQAHPSVPAQRQDVQEAADELGQPKASGDCWDGQAPLVSPFLSMEGPAFPPPTEPESDGLGGGEPERLSRDDMAAITGVHAAPGGDALLQDAMQPHKAADSYGPADHEQSVTPAYVGDSLI